MNAEPIGKSREVGVGVVTSPPRRVVLRSWDRAPVSRADYSHKRSRRPITLWETTSNFNYRNSPIVMHHRAVTTAGLTADLRHGVTQIVYYSRGRHGSPIDFINIMRTFGFQI